MKCSTCGYENGAGVKYCSECGGRMPGASELSAQSAMEGLSLGSMRTMVAPFGSVDAVDVSLGQMRTMVGPSESSDGGQTLLSEAVEERYKVLEEIGRGGFARVWKARDKKLGRLVALKRLMPEALAASDGGQTLARFRREAEAIARMNHRNIVSVFDRGEDANGPYIVMELVEGGSLRDYAKEQGGTLPVEEAVRLVKGVAQGLSYAHRNNLVHRDVKPGNILLLRDPAAKSEADRIVPKLVDFGLARAGSESEISMSGYGMGTPYYMPPEQRRDAKSVNHTADIYALGKTLYELVSGEIPDNVDPSKIPPVAGLSDTIFKCVRSNASERYFSADELLEALDGIGAREHTVSVPGGSGENPCPSCGAANLVDAKYCDDCGAGMVRVCLECGRENSVNKHFCSGCGTSHMEFSKASEALSRMEKLHKEAKPSRVVKEFESIDDCVTLRGTKGSAILKHLKELHGQAQNTLNALVDLRAKFQKASDGGDFAQAISLLASIRELDPNLPDYEVTLARLNVELDNQVWNKTLETVENAESKSAFDKAHTALDIYVKEHPTGSYLQDVKAIKERLDASLRAEKWALTSKKVDAMVSRQAFQEAAELCRQVAASLVPSDEQRATLAKAKALDELAAEHRDIETWEACDRGVKALLADGSLGNAVLQLRTFLSDYPDSRIKARVQLELDELSARYDEQVSSELAVARKLIEENHLLAAEKQLDRVTRLCGMNLNSEVTKLRLQTTTSLREVNTLVERAKEAFGIQDFDEAVHLIIRARKLDSGDSSLESLEGQYRALLEKKRVERLIRRRRSIVVFQTIAVLAVLAVVGVFVHRGLWKARFQSALSSKDLVQAQRAAKQLPKQKTIALLTSLENYAKLYEGVETDLTRLDKSMAHYDPRAKRTVDEALDSATKSSDLEQAIAFIEKAQREVTAFAVKIEVLQKTDASIESLLNRSKHGQVERLMPDKWKQVLAEVEAARALTDINVSQQALQAASQKLLACQAPLEALQTKYDAMQHAEKACVSALDVLSEDANATYLESEIKPLQAQLKSLRKELDSTLDFTDKMAELNACLREVQALGLQLRELQTAMENCNRNREEAVKARAAQFLDKQWNEVESARQGIAPEIGIEAVVRRLGDAANHYISLQKEALRLSSQRTGLLALAKRIETVLGTIRAKPFSSHAEQDLLDIESEVKRLSLDAADSPRYNDVEKKLTNYNVTLESISGSLDRYQVDWARFSQLDASLDGDREILQQEVADNYIGFTNSCQKLQMSRRLVESENLLKDLVKKADDLSVKADKLRQQQALVKNNSANTNDK